MCLFPIQGILPTFCINSLHTPDTCSILEFFWHLKYNTIMFRLHCDTLICFFLHLIHNFFQLKRKTSNKYLILSKNINILNNIITLLIYTVKVALSKLNFDIKTILGSYYRKTRLSFYGIKVMLQNIQQKIKWKYFLSYLILLMPLASKNLRDCSDLWWILG